VNIPALPTPRAESSSPLQPAAPHRNDRRLTTARIELRLGEFLFVLDVKRSTRFPASPRAGDGGGFAAAVFAGVPRGLRGPPSSRMLRITLRAMAFGRYATPDVYGGRGRDADPHRPGRRGPAALLRRAPESWDEPAGHREAWVAVRDLYAICTCPASRLHARELGCCDKSQGSQGNRRRGWHDPGAARRRVPPEQFIRPDVTRHF
jgi:hypothetical protein